MATSFAAQVRGWTEKAKRNAGLVVRDAAQTTYAAMTRRQPSVTETGGAFEVGKVPVDTGLLIGSVQVEVNGAPVVQGSPGTPPDFAMGLAGLEIGDTVQAAFTAPYARAVEYGSGRTAGRFFVREAALGWQQAVDDAAERIGR